MIQVFIEGLSLGCSQKIGQPERQISAVSIK
jgi:hypothetical protein